MTLKATFLKVSAFILAVICCLVLAGCNSKYGFTGGTAAQLTEHLSKKIPLLNILKTSARARTLLKKKLGLTGLKKVHKILRRYVAR